MQCKLPAKKGPHIIYLAWQRSDSTEAFYSCSDVNFTGGVSTFKELGQIRSAQDLSANTKVTFRLFDQDGRDLESTSTTLGFDAFTGLQTNLAANWPFALAQQVNSVSKYVSIGVLQSNNTISPVKSTQDNRVYNRSGLAVSYQIDIAAPGGTTPTPVPSATPTAKPSSSPTPTATPTAIPSTSPTPTATPTAKPSTSPTPTATATPVTPTTSPAATCAPAWNAATTYAAPNTKVSYNGRLYSNKWWTAGEVPTASGQWGVWKDLGICK
ncbi:lytic polysaccharide monooxygenase [Deefgea sp. CFH1-16]|uniref:lytic polysaccharide monooxygenase n=1 Tax=Deefgea sp. CFH1-16 TaxID=2675457 RepID=UPI0015F40C50|nr:lytic polysaccharide monooxygenase [Deefgea sp. CFH1-16]